MNENITKAKQIMEEGWKARENLEFEKAEKLLYEAKSIFEQEADWFNVTECLNHLAYNEKLQAVHHNIKGATFTGLATEISREHNTKELFILRAMMSLFSSAGNFEQALKMALKALPFYEEPSSKADILRHIAYFYLRTGDMKSAMTFLNDAEENFNDSSGKVTEPHVSIWKVSFLVTKGLFAYNLGNMDEARELGMQALLLAKGKGLKNRIEEAESF